MAWRPGSLPGSVFARHVGCGITRHAAESVSVGSGGLTVLAGFSYYRSPLQSAAALGAPRRSMDTIWKLRPCSQPALARAVGSAQTARMRNTGGSSSASDTAAQRHAAAGPVPKQIVLSIDNARRGHGRYAGSAVGHRNLAILRRGWLITDAGKIYPMPAALLDDVEIAWPPTFPEPALGLQSPRIRLIDVYLRHEIVEGDAYLHLHNSRSFAGNPFRRDSLQRRRSPVTCIRPLRKRNTPFGEPRTMRSSPSHQRPLGSAAGSIASVETTAT
jgi:hypothetical protein